MNAPLLSRPVPASIPSATDWTADPRVVALLASCAKSPPERVAHLIKPEERWTRDEWHYGYVGKRVERLRAIRSQYGNAILHACDAADDYTAFEDHSCTPSVDDAIEAAIGGRPAMPRLPQITEFCTDGAGGVL